jgi:hypothetical protein
MIRNRLDSANGPWFILPATLNTHDRLASSSNGNIRKESLAGDIESSLAGYPRSK